MVEQLLIDYLQRAEYWLIKNVGLTRFNRQSLAKEIDKHYVGGWEAFTDGYSYIA